MGANAFPEPTEADLAKLSPLKLAEVAAERGLDPIWAGSQQ